MASKTSNKTNAAKPQQVKDNTPPAADPGKDANTAAAAPEQVNTPPAPPAADQNQDNTPPAAPNAPSAKKAPVKALSVKSKVNGFRRAGRAWSTEATEVVLADLTADQVAQLKAEPLLTVTEIELAAE